MVLMLLQLLLVGQASASAPQGALNASDCPEYDRVVYTAPRKDWPGGIHVTMIQEKSPLSPIAEADAHRSPQGTAMYSVHEPDTGQPGPWTTLMTVVGNKARSLRLQIRISDHISGGVRAQWLNEQLLWLQVWRGRILSTDMILDVDSGKFIYDQDANYNTLIVPCAMKQPR